MLTTYARHLRSNLIAYIALLVGLAATLTWSVVAFAGVAADAAAPPAGPRVSGPRSPLAGTVTFTFHAKRGSRFRCSLDSPILRRCPAVFRVTVTAGAHTLRVRSVAPGGLQSRLTVVHITARRPLPSAGSVVARIRIGAAPMGLAFADGSLFVTQHHDVSVVRVDPSTNTVSGRVTVAHSDQPGRLTLGDGELWEVNYSGDPGAAVRLDPDPLRVLQTTSVPAELCCTAVLGSGSLWLAAPDRGLVYRVDRPSGDVTASIHVDNPGLGVFGAGSVWAMSGSEVVRIDPASNAIVAHIPAPAGAWVQAYAAGSVWLSTGRGLARLDPATNTITAQIQIPNAGPDWPSWVAVDGTSVWTSGKGDGRAGLWRIDASSNTVTGFVPLDPDPSAPIGDVAFGDGAVWATLFDAGTVVRVAPSATTN
jgi:hypothetical protein